MKPLHWWLVVDDAIAGTGRHTLQLRWYVRGQVVSSDNGLWSFRRPNNIDRLWITLLPSVPSTYSPISRAYDEEKEVNDAVGVEMEVPYSGRAIRLASLFSPGDSRSSVPSLQRTDFPDGTLFLISSPSQSWEWVIPTRLEDRSTIAEYGVLGQSACIVRDRELLQEFCLLNGTTLSLEDRSLVQSSVPIYLEANLDSQRIFVEATSDLELRLYWPWPPGSVTDSGLPLGFEYSEETISIRLDAGEHTLALWP